MAENESLKAENESLKAEIYRIKTQFRRLVRAIKTLLESGRIDGHMKSIDLLKCYVDFETDELKSDYEVEIIESVMFECQRLIQETRSRDSNEEALNHFFKEMFMSNLSRLESAFVMSCKECSKAFVTNRKDARFCCFYCRRDWHQRDRITKGK